MRAVLQRVSKASVNVEGQRVSEIQAGWLVLLGVAHDDTDKDAAYLAEKIIHLRAFEDENGKLNRSVKDIRGEVLVVSQFTLLADCRRGRRPSFVEAARPEHAEALYSNFCDHIQSAGIPLGKGKFQKHMMVDLTNDGPVTLIIESR